ncbi:SDR family NAD(P)-dependent oxidoreductase, partial [Pseudomonas sp. K5002]
MPQLANRRAVITGAGSGIGAAIARAYAVEGARLLLADRDAATLAETAITCRNLGAEVLECVA